jgi:hypothetical protein
MTYNVVQLKVDWKSLALAGSNQVPDHYEFLVADGGMTNNEPISLCRTAISGWTMSNPRDGLKAKRAVLLVDPFADAPALGPTSRSSFVEDLQSLIGTWKDQARYDSRDLALAVSETCFSRFMITAQRDGEDVGGKSIACASVYAFGGFLSKAYRRHDFLLGRKNCQEYLLNKLVLPMDNPLFSTWKANAKPGQIEAWRRMDGEIPSLPIIPLLGDCRNAELPEVYPSGAFNPRSTDFQDALKARLDVLLDRAKSDLAVKKLLIKIYLTIGEAFGKRALQEAATAYIEKSLKDWKL